MKTLLGYMFVLVSLYVRTAHAEHCNVLKVFGARDWQPLSYVGKNTQRVEGIGYDLIKYIADDLNVPMQIKSSVPWARGLSSLKKGQVDLAVAIYFSEERSEELIYSDSYFTNEARVFTLSNSKLRFHELKDLLNYSGGMFVGGGYGDEFDKFVERYDPLIKRVYYKEQLVGMLQLGRIDYFVLDYFDGVSFLKQQGLESKIKILDEPISSPKVYFATSKLSHCKKLLPYINKGIKKAKEAGVLNKIVEKHARAWQD